MNNHVHLYVYCVHSHTYIHTHKRTYGHVFGCNQFCAQSFNGTEPQSTATICVNVITNHNSTPDQHYDGHN